MMNKLRFNRVGIGRERRLLHQDFSARPGRPIKRRHHEVEIHRQAVHADDFVRLGADEPRRRLAHRFMIGIPGRLAPEMGIHSERGPIVQLLLNDRRADFGIRPNELPAK